MPMQLSFFWRRDAVCGATYRNPGTGKEIVSKRFPYPGTECPQSGRDARRHFKPADRESVSLIPNLVTESKSLHKGSRSHRGVHRIRCLVKTEGKAKPVGSPKSTLKS